jgi:uncharacterized membrane protein (UPF0127 family)
MVWPIKWLLIFSAIFWIDSGLAQEKAPLKFEKKKISIGKTSLSVEVAETVPQHQQGLMYREKLSDGEGMMFVFSRPETRSFWMKNTYLDLSIGFFDEKKRLFQILDMKGTTVMQKEFPSYESQRPAQFALEVPKGWFTKFKVKVGDKFEWR